MRASETFDEAWGWALQWEGSALTDWEDRASGRGNGRARQASGLQNLLAADGSRPNNGTDAAFREPRGWALGWDAEALSSTGRGVA
jgi:hypothetical protein